MIETGEMQKRSDLVRLLAESERTLANARRDGVDAATIRTFEEIVERYRRLLDQLPDRHT